MNSSHVRECPACGSTQVTLVPRGYVGKTDTADQYFICQVCGQSTYEIVSVTQRDIRLYRFEVNGVYHRDDRTYTVRRLLKVGFDEYLLYLRAEPMPLRPVDMIADEPTDEAGSIVLTDVTAGPPAGE